MLACTQEIIKQFGGDVPVYLADWQLQALGKLGIKHEQTPDAATSPNAQDPGSAMPDSRLMSPDLMFLKAHGMPPIDPRLLAGLRVMLLEEDERYLIQLTSPDAWGKWSVPISKPNEVWLSLQKRKGWRQSVAWNKLIRSLHQIRTHLPSCCLAGLDPQAGWPSQILTSTSLDHVCSCCAAGPQLPKHMCIWKMHIFPDFMAFIMRRPKC